MKNSSPRLLITGGDGQLAHAMKYHSQAREHFIFPCSRKELDILNAQAIDDAINEYKPNIIINTAAFTAVDQLEIDKKENSNNTSHLVSACKNHHIPLIHISTDYVFDGKQNIPYKENDIPNPINEYGKSKLAGEKIIATQLEQYIILRVSGIFSQYKKNFFTTLLNAAQQKKEISVVADQITCPTSANDIASAIYTLTANMHTYGIYHFCSHEAVSWYEFTKTFVDNAVLKPISLQDYQTPAQRPIYSVLNCDKIRKDYGITQPSWRDAIKLLLKKDFL